VRNNYASNYHTIPCSFTTLPVSYFFSFSVYVSVNVNRRSSASDAAQAAEVVADVKRAQVMRSMHMHAVCALATSRRLSN